jgi:N-acetyl-beta-hexosaminidase
MMDREQIREVIEDAIARAAEAGWTIAEVREEIDYAIQTCAEEVRD